MAMNYLQELANALGPRVEEAAKDSTFLNFANTMSSPVPYQQGSNPNPWQVALIESLKGFVGGASEAYGKHQIKSDMRDFSQQWANAAGSKDPIAAFAANPELAEYAPQIQLKKQMIDAEAAQKQRERVQKMADQTFLNPGTEKMGDMERPFRIVAGPDGKPQKVYGEAYPRWKPGGGTTVNLTTGPRKEMEMGTQAADFRKAIQGDSQLGDMYKVSESLTSLDTLLDVGNNVSEAIARASVARGLAGETGVMTDKDIERYIPDSLKAQLGRVSNYFSGKTDETFSADTVKAIRAVIAAKKADMAGKVEQRKQQYYKAAEYELPFFSPEQRTSLVDNYFTGFNRPSAPSAVAQQRIQESGPGGQQVGQSQGNLRPYEKDGKRFIDVLGPEGNVIEQLEVR